MAKSLKWISLLVLGLLVVVAGGFGLIGRERVLFSRYITISSGFCGIWAWIRQIWEFPVIILDYCYFLSE